MNYEKLYTPLTENALTDKDAKLKFILEKVKGKSDILGYPANKTFHVTKPENKSSYIKLNHLVNKMQ